MRPDGTDPALATGNRMPPSGTRWTRSTHRDLGYTFHGSAMVITRFLRTSWLWDRVRVQGGAYGAFCRLDRLAGVFGCVSYRDPNVEQTLKAFDEMAAFLARVPLPREEIDMNIIGAIGDQDAYLLPDAKGYVALVRSLTGHTQEVRDRIRAEVFGTTESHFRQFGAFLSQLTDKSTVVVLGGEESLRKVSAPLGLQLVSVL